MEALNKKLIVALIVLITVLSFAVSAPMAFASGGGNYNYARKDDILYSEMGTADIISQATGEIVCDVEREHLSDSELKLSYSTAISMSTVTADIVDGNLFMTMKPFEYVAQNGMTVVWTPYSIGDTLLECISGEYVYELNNIAKVDYDSLDIVYHATVAVRGDDINDYINSAYDYALSIHTRLESERSRYENEMDAYNIAIADYKQYLENLSQYESDKANYDAYLKAYSEWMVAKNAYAAYLTALDKYKSDTAKYEAYLVAKDKYNIELQAYLEYLTKYEAYQKELDEYNKATASQEKQTAIYQLKILDFITKPMTELDRTLSGAILGESVTRVLAEKESLVTIGGVEGRAVDLASAATEKLRVLITRLMQCSSDAERYTFYIFYKDELATNFIDLLVALDFIYQYPDYNLVRRIMERENGVEKFEILLAQLYCISHALTEGDLPNYVMKYKGASKKYAGFFDANYTVGIESPQTPIRILGDDYLEDKSLSEPLENGYPGLPVEPIAPNAVAKPTAPETVYKPVEPTKVAEAGVEPTKINEPTKPTVVNEPTKPIEYKPSDEEIRYENALISGELYKRELLKGSQTIVLECTLTKYFRNARSVTVRFFDGKSDTPICVVDNVEIGGSVSFSGEIPTKRSDGYDYTFSAWQDEDGNLIDCNKLITDKSDLSLYPYFDRSPRNFPIIWVIDGVRYKEYYPFDSIPDPSVLGEITKSAVGVREYRFIGWQSDGVFYKEGSELLKVEMTEREYEAVFESSWVITYKVDGYGTSFAVWDGEIPILPENVTKKNTRYSYYTFIGWDSDITVADSDATYNAVFKSEYYALNGTAPMGATIENGVLKLDGSSVNDRYVLTNAFQIAKTEELSIVISCGDSSINVPKESVLGLINDGVASLKLDTIRNYLSGSYKFILNCCDLDGNAVNSNSAIAFELSGVNHNESSAIEDEKFTITADGKVSFFISSSESADGSYSIKYYYEITVGSVQGANAIVDKSRAEKGETITVTVNEIEEGGYIGSMYYIDSSGNSVSIKNNEFNMPDSDVRISVIIEYYKYTVTFKANGKVVFTQVYRYGDKVEAPTVPDISADTGYIYRFIGWDADITDAYQDIEYNALFEKIEDDTPIDAVPSNGSLDNLVKILVVLFYVAIGVIAVLAIVIPILVVRKKRKKTAQSSTDSMNEANDDDSSDENM